MNNNQSPLTPCPGYDLRVIVIPYATCLHRDLCLCGVTDDIITGEGCVKIALPLIGQLCLP